MVMVLLLLPFNLQLLPNIYRYCFLKGDCYQCFSAPSGLQQQGDLTGFIPPN